MAHGTARESQQCVRVDELVQIRIMRGGGGFAQVVPAATLDTIAASKLDPVLRTWPVR
jgi:hypothetical protein